MSTTNNYNNEDIKIFVVNNRENINILQMVKINIYNTREQLLMKFNIINVIISKEILKV